MFNLKGLQRGKLNPVWWAVIAVIGAALLLLSKQLALPALPANTLPPEPVSQAEAEQGTPADSAKNEAFLAEYDPENVSLLDVGDDERSGVEMSIDLVLKLGLVLGLVYIAMHGLRWLQKNKSNNLSAGGATINVLETTGLAPGRSLHLVVIGEKTLLLGATDHQISVLAELADAAIPLPEENTAAFEAALDSHQQTPEEAPVTQQSPPEFLPLPPKERPQELEEERPLPPLPPLDLENAVEYSSSWQSAVDDLRTGIRNIHKSVGK